MSQSNDKVADRLNRLSDNVNNLDVSSIRTAVARLATSAVNKLRELVGSKEG